MGGWRGGDIDFGLAWLGEAHREKTCFCCRRGPETDGLSHIANDYVKKLFRDRISRRQKLLLWSLADYHNTARRAAWPSLRTLAEESLMDVRECRRVLDELEAVGLIQRIQGGQGPGDFNEYRFIELDGKDGHMTPLNKPVEKAAKDGQKDGRKDGREDGQNGRAIRKEELELEREHKNPPTPLAGGLTPRQLKELSKELDRIYQAGVGVSGGTDFDDRALRTACLRLLLPLDLAKQALARAYGEQWWHGMGLV